MADMQLLEVYSEWKTFWGNRTTFEPIATLAEVAGALHNIHPGHFARATLKDWIDVFAADDGVDIEKTLDFVCKSHAQNQQSFKRGRMTKTILRRMDQMHIAIQLVRSEQNGSAIEAMKLDEQILTQQPDGTRIEFFVDLEGW